LPLRPLPHPLAESTDISKIVRCETDLDVTIAPRAALVPVALPGRRPRSADAT
jgi:hypothetical protein